MEKKKTKKPQTTTITSNLQSWGNFAEESLLKENHYISGKISGTSGRFFISLKPSVVSAYGEGCSSQLLKF